MQDLTTLLQSTFGHPAFRPNQEAVCRAATSGRDCLLVMPTGAGKSLCYQLPAVARQSAGDRGTALVVSPLIALMDDQAAKLTAAGLRVARIHSGLSRDDARQACRDYLDGHLQFLFIAPERMRVPGFPEMLARRKPALVAIDEAHCISAWGHDFRPDYRTLGEHLPALRPAPILALTATATPAVQRDIVAQLNLQSPALFIHGFRRDNLHIEVLELSKPRRTEFASTFLADPTRRPAIVYAPSRALAEELAAALNQTLRNRPSNKFLGAPSQTVSPSEVGSINPRAPFIAPLSHAMSGSTSKSHPIAAPYHAGLAPQIREQVQRDFQSGKLEVVVATIAFGMGIDKADVRTVIHAALPASVEAYYQEIGRAGRDGLPSTTVLLYSYQDRKMHDFFLERDYPVLPDLLRVARALTPNFQMPDILRQNLKMDPDTFAKATEKLASQGVAQFDMAGNVRLAPSASASATWQSSYSQQVDFRRGQIDRMMAFAETQQCRMTALIRHFGDTADSTLPCGHCDFCAPTATTSQTFAEPTAVQDRDLRTILRALAARSTSTGKLHTDLALTPDRKVFDALLEGLARAGLITLASEQWTNPEGIAVTFKKAALTHEGRELRDPDPLNVLLPPTPETPASTKKRKRVPQVSTASSSTLGSSPSVPHSSQSHRDEWVPTPAQKTLEAALRAFRKAEAAKTGKPAFIVFGDTALTALVQAAPRTIPELLSVSGFGPDKAERYGAAITAIFRNEEPATSRVTQVSTVSPSTLGSSHSAQTPQSNDSFGQSVLPNVNSAESWKERSRFLKEHVTYLEPSSKKARLQASEYDKAAYRRLDFEEDLRVFARRQADTLKVSPADIVSESLIAEILRMRPRSLGELQRLNELRGDLPQSFYVAMVDVCNAEYVPPPTHLKHPQPRKTAVDEIGVRKSKVVYTDNRPSSPVKERTSPIMAFGEPTPTFHRGRPLNPAEPESLTPTQQALEATLRTWRKSESERLGLPQFFVLGTSTLRSIVLTHPRTLPQLSSITGIGPEKLDKFGPAILELCKAQA